MPTSPPARSFTHIGTWVFDLDNTLYPHHLNLWQQVDARIRMFIADFLKVPIDEAFRLQKDYYRRYGTTLRGLMIEHALSPDHYLDYVHRIDHSPLEPNPVLSAALGKLPGRKLVLTNGTRQHADAVMKKLEVREHFEEVFDIVAAGLEPKPSPKTYARFFEQRAVDPSRAVMFEDLARNLETPHALGMITVLVVPQGTHAVFREDWELEGQDAPYIDHVTQNLVDFIENVAASLNM